MKIWATASALAFFATTLAFGRVTPNERSFAAGTEAKIAGVIITRDGNIIKLRGDDDAIDTIDLTNTTRIQMKHGMFGWSHASMDVNSLVPGLRVEAQGKGNDQGQLVADRVVFDPNSMRASRQIDTRVSPLEARAGTLEGRAGALEGRAGQLENRQGHLEDQENQTQQQVGQVKVSADQANQGVTSVNKRVTDLDNYETKDSATVYFKLGSSVLSPDEKKKLDDLAEKAKNEKGYMLQIAGFADTTGNATRNQELSERRANAVIEYLEQQGDIPLRRILAPAGMGTSHPAQSNDSSAGRKLNRRVEISLLVNQGVVSENGMTSDNTPAPPPPPPPAAPQAQSAPQTPAPPQ